jgi:hypothetical protein
MEGYLVEFQGVSQEFSENDSTGDSVIGDACHGVGILDRNA